MKTSAPDFFENSSQPSSRPTPKRAYNVIFCSAALDDYGLSPAQFRLLGHIARRAGDGKCFAAVTSMATICRLHPRTVRTALRSLTAFKIITRETRQGETSIYRLNTPSQWMPPAGGYSSPLQNQSPASVSRPSQAKPIEDYPPQSDTAEGYPIEVNPNKGIPSPIAPKGAVNQGLSPLLVSQANAVYSAYPLQSGRPAALRAIKSVIREHGYEFVLGKTQQFAATCANDLRFVPSPAKWFRDQRYNDDPTTWKRTPSVSMKSQPAIINPADFGNGVGAL